jgi:hypothetical protein
VSTPLFTLVFPVLNSGILLPYTERARNGTVCRFCRSLTALQPQRTEILHSLNAGNAVMKKTMVAGAALIFVAVSSSAFAAPEEAGTAAGAQAGAISAGTSTAVGIGALGALVGLGIAASGGGDGANTGTTTTTTTSTTR